MRWYELCHTQRYVMSTPKLALIVGQNIAVLRKKMDLSQKELAARLGITQDAMARMEKGQIAPKMGRLSDIAAVLECSVPYLFRSHSTETSERAATIAAILSTLPQEGQEALVDLVASAAQVMKMRDK